jgi:hypothetical protein
MGLDARADDAGEAMRSVLTRQINVWLQDAESAVEYTEELEGRIAVRMRQTAREATTVWFKVGQRSLEYEAYLIPTQSADGEVFRQALVRNSRGWRAFFALDGEGGLVLRGRLAAIAVTPEELDQALGEIYATVEAAFRPMVRAAFTNREISG